MSSSAPLLSVIVPAKDQADFVSDCLTSLTRQAIHPESLEVILVDDGSRDGTGEIAADFRCRLPLMRVLCNELPRGLASARNQGLDVSTGRLVTYLDADDWLAPGHLGHLVEQINRLDVDFIRTDHVRSAGAIRTVQRAPEARRNTRLLPRESILPHTRSTMVDYCYAWAGIFDRRIEHLLRFPDGLHTAEDRPWAWRLHLQAASYAVVSSPGILYRRGVSTSLTQISDRRQLDFLRSFRSVFDLVDADVDAAIYWPKAARMFLAVLAHHLTRSNQMERGDAKDLVSGGRAVVQRIPASALHVATAGLAPARLTVLSAVLPRRPARRSLTGLSDRLVGRA